MKAKTASSSPALLAASEHPQEGSCSPPRSDPFPYQDYLRAKQDLLAAFRAPSCFYALLTGASGMGKTSLLRDLGDGLERHRHHVIYISSKYASGIGITRYLAHKLHVVARRSGLETLHELSLAIRAQTAEIVLWIDEADQVDPSTLQEVRLLAEADLDQRQLLSVVLSGLPTLSGLLDAPTLFPLKRRIEVRCTLGGLRRAELDPFLIHRFGVTDAGRIPDGELRDELFERTQAAPALMDTIVRNTLARAAHEDAVHPDELRAVLDLYDL
jgi:general secretion pathway protein A